MKNKTFVRDPGSYLIRSDGLFIASSQFDGYSVSYKYAEKQQEIRFSGNKIPYSNKVRAISVTIFSKESAIMELFNKLTIAGYNPAIPSSAINNDRFWFEIPEIDKQKLIPALKIIKQFLSIQNIMKEIFTGLELKSISDPVAFYKNLELLIKNGQFSEAISQAKNIECDENVLWTLVNLLEKYEAYPEALDICQEISPENIHYNAANERAIEIIQKYEINTINLDSRDKLYFLESKIRFMLRISTPDYQTILDKHFSEFCGASPMLPLLHNIGTNEDTLISAGKAMRSMAQELRDLKAEYKNLWGKIESGNNKTNLALENNKNIFFQNPSENCTKVIPEKPNYPIPVLPCAIL